jgi:ArsR family transcriptional regulator
MSKSFPVVESCCQTSPAPRLKQAGELVEVYRALADETRLRILALLRDGEVCVCHIHGGLRLPQPTISRHLAYLRKTGLVEARREGVWMHYRLATPSSSVVRHVLDAALHALSHAEVTAIDTARMRKERDKAVATLG